MKDSLFIRGKVPMTKAEVRAVSISKLELPPDAVVYDVGAGTGSVTIEMALQLPQGTVYAIERNSDAVDLLHQNCEKFSVSNVKIVPGLAQEVFAGLPVATHAFLGGTGGHVEEILRQLLSQNPHMRIVINVIALESLQAVCQALKKMEIEPEIVCMQVSRAEKAGPYHLMKGENPVYILSFGGAEA